MAAALRISLLKLITISLALLCAASMPGLAQEWPTKTVRILVPFGPGSTPNIVARLIAEGLTKKYPDSTFLVENKPGASGNLATDVVAKAAPNGATLGISIGGPLAINTLLFSNLPYPGSPQAIMAVIRNDVQLACLPAISVTPQAAAGTVKILAASAAKRSPYLPDVPTLKEAGIDVEADAWNGLIAPGGTPQPVIAKIKKDVVEIIRQPAARERLAAQLMEAVGSTPEDFRARIDGEIARWAPVIQAENIKIN
jgi:tripartite-type tricarboxylate transporter receptor subunit TctC